MKDKVVNIVIVLCLIPIIGFSQINSIENNLGKGYFGLGFDIGITSFFGDIDEGAYEGDPFKNNIAWKLYINKSFYSLISMEGSLSSGNLSGEKKRGGNGLTSYQYFQAEYLEYTFSAGVNLLGIFSSSVNSRFSFYASVGFGLIDFKTQVFDGTNDSLVQSYGYDGQKSTTEMVIPFGIRAIYDIIPNLSVSVQTTFNRVDTDKLDAVTGNNNRDYYNFTSIGLIYKFYPGGDKGNLSGSKGRSLQTSSKKPKSNLSKQNKSRTKKGKKRKTSKSKRSKRK